MAGSLVYINQLNVSIKSQELELEKQKEQTKIDDAKKADELKAQTDLSNSLNYLKCTKEADDKRNSDLEINSNYETKDSDGNVIYHGDATVFNNINQTATQEKALCSKMYQ
ncbi:MAG TPA: hypothetical protein PLZ58_02895 [Candidatus Saccharibacteria bacterium]|nr:hypothetical protein [Candidatus Saccharibacteria bacterium]HRQ06718.1 hypothetical protein [Candidatus Saccharibacteria bacterium]